MVTYLLPMCFKYSNGCQFGFFLFAASEIFFSTTSQIICQLSGDVIIPINMRIKSLQNYVPPRIKLFVKKKCKSQYVFAVFGKLKNGEGICLGRFERPAFSSGG